MGLNYQQALTGLCFLLVVLLMVDIHLRWAENAQIEVNYVANQMSEKEGEENKHQPPTTTRFDKNPLEQQQVVEANIAAQLTEKELDYVLEHAIRGEKQSADCKPTTNIFFLKSSKTGSTTMMSIFQRFGLKYGSRFLMGENHGGMAVNNRPFNLEDDCWIGKNLKGKKVEFELSTNHLHYNKTAIDFVMKSPYVRIGIAREPESHFISSYNFYHNLMPKLSYRLNPMADYNIARKKMARKKMFGDKKPVFAAKPNKEDIKYEINMFLRNPWKYVEEYGTNSFAYMANIRPQLLFYGKSRNGTPSFDRNLTRQETLDWIKDVAGDFDLMMMLDQFDYSLALICLQFCIPTDDMIYIAVNQRHDHSEKAHLTAENLIRLKQLNWPDFLFYQAFNTSFWRKVEYYGESEVARVAEEIKSKSQRLSSDCIDFENEGRDKLIDRVFLKEDKMTNSTCLKLQFQGVRASKLFMVNQIEEVMEMSNKKYQFCGKKLAYGNDVDHYQIWKHVYLDRYRALFN